jgi:glutathione S-transferase
MMRLYQFESCPYCSEVRQKLSDLLLTYVAVSVPRDRGRRKEVMEVSGQPSVPVLVDGDVVLSDEDEIVAYLDKTYGKAGK